MRHQQGETLELTKNENMSISTEKININVPPEKP